METGNKLQQIVDEVRPKEDRDSFSLAEPTVAELEKKNWSWFTQLKEMLWKPIACALGATKNKVKTLKRITLV